MIVQTIIAVQQAGNGIILVAIGGKKIEIYIFIKTVCDALGLIRQAVEGLVGEVKLSK